MVYHSRQVDNLPSLEEVWSATSNTENSRNEKSRGLPLGLVLGPSGSGKTFFSMQHLGSKFLNAVETDRVTIYLKPSASGVIFNKQTNSKAATALFDWIKEEIARKEKVSIEAPLRMHVCFIIDEAGAEDVKLWFEDKAMLTALCGEARKMAESVAIVVSGTGLTGRDLSSANDAFIFRMKRWEAPDLEKILGKEKGKLFLEANETTETVANAIFAHPELGALATNGRAAYFLSKAIQNMSDFYPRISWAWQLAEWAPWLVAQVVDSYSYANGISNLNRSQRCRIVASIFRALDNLRAGEAVLPIFEGIEQGRETAVASSLLQYNLEINGAKGIVKGELFAFTVTPAIAIIPYAMAGISTTLMTGWKAEESIAALYAYRQLMLECMESFLTANVQEMKQSDCYKRNHYEELDQSLSRIRLVLLRNGIQMYKRSVYVPMLGAGTVIVNGAIAAFADVIAPYCLIQARRVTSEQCLDVDLLSELSKIGLAASIDCGQADTRMLQGLVAMWQGNLDPLKFLKQDVYSNPKEGLNWQMSKEFPDDLWGIDTRTENEKIRYALISEVGATEIAIDNGTKLHLPSLDRITLTFIMSTNARRIKLKLSSETALEISEAMIDSDLSINAELIGLG